MPLMFTSERASNGSRQKPWPMTSGGVGDELLLQHREARIDEDDVARLAHVVGRAETDGAALVLGEAVHPGAHRAVERHLLAVVGEEVLPEILALALEQVAQPADDREVAQDGVLLLGDVLDEPEHQDRDEDEAQQRAQAVGDDAHRTVHASP